MDPDVTLAEARRHVAEADKAYELASAADESGKFTESAHFFELSDMHKAGACAAYGALDEWLTKGGFPPYAWAPKR